MIDSLSPDATGTLLPAMDAGVLIRSLRSHRFQRQARR
jgi:hypothetical protein